MEELQQCIQDNEPLLNQDQQQVYQKVLDIINNNGGIFLLDAPGGTGKTFETFYLQTPRKSSSSSSTIWNCCYPLAWRVYSTQHLQTSIELQ